MIILKERFYKLDNIRAFAILSVVLGHSIILYSSKWFIYLSDNNVVLLDLLKNIINLYQMPLFFSLSGFLFLRSLTNPIKFKNLIFNKFRRLIIPFFVFAFGFMIPIKILLNYPNYIGASFYRIVYLLFTCEDAGHLWYLPTLFFIFVIIFILYRISKIILKKDLICLIFIGISLVILNIINIRLNTFSLVNNTIIYSIYFFFGMLINYFKVHNCDINVYIKIFIFVLLGIIIFFTIFLDNYIINLLCGFIIVIFTYLLFPNTNVSILKKISDQSFGIYLIHSPLIYITFTYFRNLNPLFVISINFILFGFIAYMWAYLLSKTRIKWVIGR